MNPMICVVLTTMRSVITKQRAEVIEMRSLNGKIPELGLKSLYIDIGKKFTQYGDKPGVKDSDTELLSLKKRREEHSRLEKSFIASHQDWKKQSLICAKKCGEISKNDGQSLATRLMLGHKPMYTHLKTIKPKEEYDDDSFTESFSDFSESNDIKRSTLGNATHNAMRFRTVDSMLASVKTSKKPQKKTRREKVKLPLLKKKSRVPVIRSRHKKSLVTLPVLPGTIQLCNIARDKNPSSFCLASLPHPRGFIDAMVQRAARLMHEPLDNVQACLFHSLLEKEAEKIQERYSSLASILSLVNSFILIGCKSEGGSIVLGEGGDLMKDVN
ncbi:hypothetical protein ADUPG1_005991 [Aduncisulcus paluster]|uniref:Uncharacterized protein n=1 Tax=Aduncisulcus paluster TaxID=2918883 RepID=A0ABQ5KGD1_9EUKA|nr:hypothetical protein ADUPG1_005991 [Aduncisulcus paluster]